MLNTVVIRSEIEDTRRQLELTAKNRTYNFNHPEVLALSRKLDHLILKAMHDKPARSK